MPTTDTPQPVVVDASRSSHATLRPIPITAVALADDFWRKRREINRTVTLPSQYRHLEDTGRLNNFRRAAGHTDLKFEGIFFNDSDVYKWLEAAGSALAEGDSDGSLTRMVDTAVDLVAAAQGPDGYLNTYFMFEREKDRWSNLKDMHELYCAGHLIQAAVAHYRGTGSTRLLDVARRVADNIVDVFGPGGRAGACGHEEVEMALVELGRATGDGRYIDQAQRFVDVRGQGPRTIDRGTFGPRYRQDHVPFRELYEVTGHAVRMMYLAAGGADLLLERGEPAIRAALERQWESMKTARAYVTGGLGARYEGEAFGKDYELPNERAYTETCAAIGAVMWSWRMLLATGEARYADWIEHTLFNAVLPGLSLDGQAYFYENPLADDGEHRRQPWFGCACCPPNVARLLAQLPGYFASTAGDAVVIHQYARGEIRAALDDGTVCMLTVETDYPWDGAVSVITGSDREYALHLRIPGWCEAGKAALTVNGEPVTGAALAPSSYAVVDRAWKAGDVVRLALPMPVRYLEAHPYALENTGRVAVQRGPLVYCLEQADNAGVDPRDIVLPADPAALTAAWREDLFGGIMTLTGPARIAPLPAAWAGHLYRSATQGLAAEANGRAADVTMIPYYAWANRDSGRMQLWLRRDRDAL
jgi:hypothetical protein